MEVVRLSSLHECVKGGRCTGIKFAEVAYTFPTLIPAILWLVQGLRQDGAY